MDPNQNTPLKIRLSTLVDLRIPHFSRSVPPGTVLQYTLKPTDTEFWYHTFRDTLLEKLGHKHYPVFRWGDGECVFSVGYRMARPSSGQNPIWYYCRTALSAYVKHRLHRNFLSGTPSYGYERYNHREWLLARQKFVHQLQRIAQEGSIGFNFVVQQSVPFCDQYIAPVCDWLDQHRINISDHNYFPCYFVYALLTGPDLNVVLAGRHVLVVTSDLREKSSLLASRLLLSGACSVQFLSISRSRAMLDVISLADVKTPVDVALIGAGVGAANVIDQLRPLNAVCIDSGFALDCLAEPALRGCRVYTLPDTEA
jgi:hypothetical protein